MYRILIADDEGLSINSMTYMLDEAFGDSCEIRTAQTGRAVIEIAEAFHPDIAVMDIRDQRNRGDPGDQEDLSPDPLPGCHSL